jgi:hypothetical protein
MLKTVEMTERAIDPSDRPDRFEYLIPSSTATPQRRWNEQSEQATLPKQIALGFRGSAGAVACSRILCKRGQ